jgi:hypothetical protein
MTWLGFGRLLKNHRLLSNPEEIAGQVMTILPRIGGGTLRFWGQWFGKPYDNCHQVVSCEVDGDLLQIHFNENETLSVRAPRNAGFEERPHPLEPGSWSPSGRALKEQVFSIGDAERVRWEWFYYGRPQAPENRRFIEFVRTADGIATDNGPEETKRNLRPDLKLPAVELISLSFV